MAYQIQSDAFTFANHFDPVAHIPVEEANYSAHEYLLSLPDAAVTELRRIAKRTRLIRGTCLDCSKSRELFRGGHTIFNEKQEDLAEEFDCIGEEYGIDNLGENLLSFQLNFNKDIWFPQYLGKFEDSPRYASGEEGQKQWDNECQSSTRLFEGIIATLRDHAVVNHFLKIQTKLMLSIWTDGRDEQPIVAGRPQVYATDVGKVLKSLLQSKQVEVIFMACVNQSQCARSRHDAERMQIPKSKILLAVNDPDIMTKSMANNFTGALGIECTTLERGLRGLDPRFNSRIDSQPSAPSPDPTATTLEEVDSSEGTTTSSRTSEYESEEEKEASLPPATECNSSKPDEGQKVEQTAQNRKDTKAINVRRHREIRGKHTKNQSLKELFRKDRLSEPEH